MVYHLASECGYSYEYIVNMTVRQIRLFFEGKSRSVTETQKGIETKESDKNFDVGSRDDTGQIKGLMSLLGQTKIRISKRAKEKLEKINKNKMLNNKGKKDA